MKIKDLQDKKIDELKSLLLTKRLAVKDLRFKDANHQLKDVREIREIKKDIAQILTLINQTKK
jgi:large subunit ribosomal protein L29